MTDKTQKRILNALLDKYERSNFFRDDKEPTRRILLNFYNGGKSDFSYYDIEQSERRILVNRAIEDLAEQGLLAFQWMKGERGHIIAIVWLNMDNLGRAYRTAEREAKGDAVSRVCAEIAEVRRRVKSEWICSFLDDSYIAISEKRRITGVIPNDDTERRQLLQTITAIDSLDGAELTERVFSMRTFGNSKIFEGQVKPRLIRVLRRYLDIDDDVTDENVLRLLGIVKYPEQFEFCGNISVWFEAGQVSFYPMRNGSVIYSSDFDVGRIIIDKSVKSVITIENRANYIEFIRSVMAQNELVIYHGGQYSPRKRKFLQAIAKAMPDHCSWYHWSDIDYGGFLMLSRIRREICPGAIPYRMDVDELVRYKSLTAKIEKQYCAKLEKLKNRPELADCISCIDYIIHNMVRLEQEAMLIISD